MQTRWDLSYLYSGFDDPAFTSDLNALKSSIEEARTALASADDDRAFIKAFIAENEAISCLTEKLFSYCELTLSADASNAQAEKYLDQVMLLSNDISLLSSSVVRRLGNMQNLEEILASLPEAAPCAFALREMAEEARHSIPEAIEPWILKMQLSGGGAFSMLRNKLDATHLVEYRGESLPLSSVRGLAYSPDESVRRDAYEGEITSYSKMEIPMASCLNSIKMEARTLSELKGYPSVLDMTLAESRMDRETLDAMWTAVREALPDFRRYLLAKARLLGHKNGLPFFDLFAPVGKSRTYSLEEAHDLLLREMGKFTPKMAEFMDHAFQAGWIDVYPRAGKSGGAFCAGVHSFDRSLVLTNFQGSFSDVSTLAHELGHAWHNRCLAGLPYLMIDTPMPLAETASIFNETMLSYQVLSSCSPEEELHLLENGLMEATQTVVDIYSRFLFESEVIQTRADHAMTPDELKDAMLRAQDASYGEGLDPAFRHPYMWACKSHYYSSGLNFYNFPYAFGLLFGKGVFARYLKEGSAFVDTYCQLLRSCGSAPVAEVAASVGIDVHSVDFWRESLSMIRRDIDRFCALCE